MDYFAVATGLARAEGQMTMARIAAKAIALKTQRNRADVTCCCSAHHLPHRAGTGACPGKEPRK